MAGPPGLSDPPGLAGVDRPNGNGWAHGPERPPGPAPGASPAERPGSAPVPGHGIDRPQLPTAGQVIREVLGVPRQPAPTGQVIQVPGQPGPAQQAPAMAAQANPAAVGSTVQGGLQPGQTAAAPAHVQQTPMHAPAAIAPRADAAVAPAPQRADAAPHAAQAAAGMRADAMHVQRAQDAAAQSLQRTATPQGATVAPPTSTSTAATTAANALATTAAATLGTAAAVNVAGHTAASGPLAAPQAGEARNLHNPIAAIDRSAPPRPDAAGYTGEGPQRRSLDRNARTLTGGLSTLLMALGVQGHTGASGRDPVTVERELRETMMQWLFWLLAIVAYGCLGFAIVALLPVGSQLPGGGSARGWTGGAALIGLFTAVAAWWIARKLGPRRG